MEHADSQDVLQSTCTRLESACTRLQKSGIEFLKRGRRDFMSKGFHQDLGSVFIFWRTFSLIKGSYLDQYHCGEPVISSRCEETSEEETRERLLKIWFYSSLLTTDEDKDGQCVNGCHGTLGAHPRKGLSAFLDSVPSGITTAFKSHTNFPSVFSQDHTWNNIQN